MQFRLDHIHFRSPDPEATAEYYEKMLGAEITRSTYPVGSPYAGKSRLTMNLGGQKMLIAPTHPSKATAAFPQTPYFGIEHIGLTVENIDAATAELEAKGAEFVQKPAMTASGNRNAFIRCPQGVLVEIIQKGVNLKEPTV
jgi:catechol 2,3-dioxygenase-like lactoylglutathione lyase family enzyme